MKNRIIILSLVSSAFFSCKKVDVSVTKKVTEEKEISINNSLTECYEYIKNKDTIKAQIVINDTIVSGDLNYKLFQKDKNTGKIAGTLSGDTIFADYTFMSEGIESVRQVAFLRKNKTLVEGYGESKEIKGKSVFQDTKKLNFTSSLVLTEVTCN